MQKIQIIMNFADNHIDNYIRSGKYKSDFQERDNRSFYRLYSYSMMHEFFEVFQSILINYGSLGEFIADKASTAMEALEMITTHFAQRGISTIIPKSTSSACKRLCMFLRWMVRDSSPVDLVLWRNIIDKRSLIIPLDTHVLSEANNLNLIKSHSATMTTAIRLTDILKEVFPDDPMRGDFALFGYGVNKSQGSRSIVQKYSSI